MARIMLSVRGEKAGDAIVADFPDDMPLADAWATVTAEIEAERQRRPASQEPTKC
jgi:class 3 adenylate cyclase